MKIEEVLLMIKRFFLMFFFIALLCGNLTSGFGETITLDYVYDGSGTKNLTLDASDGFYVNSWNADSVKVNGTDYTNTYKLFTTCGTYEIVYESSVGWAHIEIKKSGSCSGGGDPTDAPASDPPTDPPASDPPTNPPTDPPASDPPTNPPTPPPGEGFPIPGSIEAEDYNDGGEGVGYHDTNGSPALETNPGGQHVSYIESGEWLAYTVNVTAGNYYIDVYVASSEGGGAIHIEFDDVDITGVHNFAANGSWTEFIVVTCGPVTLSGGEQLMKIGMNGTSFNVDKVEFIATSETPSPSPTPTAVPTPSPVPPAVPVLHTDGIWIRDASDNAVVLRGVATGDLDAIYKGDRSHLIETTIFDIIDYAEQKLGNVYVIRLDIHPEVNDETGNHGWLHYEPQWYFDTIIDPAVQHCISKGMYAIIDWHYVGVSWTQNDVVENTETFWLGDGSWAGIASEYANNPNVLFELFNEPGGGEWSSWKTTATGWIDGIRAKGADNIIIVGGPNWSQVMPQSSSDLIDRDNIVYACHIYPSHAGGGMPNWIDYVSTAAPVMMTEWGYENNSDANVTTGTKTSYGQSYRDWLDAKPQVGWIAWCFDYCYRSVMCDMNWELLGNGLSTTETRYHGGVDDTYENYMGYFVKDWLYDKRNDYSPGSGGTGPTTVPTDAPTNPPNTDPPTNPPTNPPNTDPPTNPPTEPPNGGGCTCDAGCSSITTFSPNFTKDGSGEFCFEATSLGSYINSWNLTVLEVNGVDLTNKYTSASSLPEKIDGKYYVYYKSTVTHGHFESKN
jgi:hypothetical protein